MKCEDLLRMLNDYVDGDIDPSICEEFQKHLDECNPCEVVVDTVRKTIILYKENGVFELPIAFREKLHQTLRDRWKEKQDGARP